jgi:hypothetical protein
MAAVPLSDSQLRDGLRKQFVGKTLLQIPTPSALLDLSKVQRNCARMLEAVDELQFKWRPHIKTHKVGSNSRRVPRVLSLLLLEWGFFDRAHSLHSYVLLGRLYRLAHLLIPSLRQMNSPCSKWDMAKDQPISWYQP